MGISLTFHFQPESFYFRIIIYIYMCIYIHTRVVCIIHILYIYTLYIYSNNNNSNNDDNNDNDNNDNCETVPAHELTLLIPS